MIRIAICDDALQELQNTKSILTTYIENHPQYEITIHDFSAPLELLAYVSSFGGFDIIVLDIYMAGLLGTEVARELRQLGDTCDFIFITSSRDHAIEAFELNAAQYLLKPYTKEALFSAVDRVFQRFNTERRVVIPFKTVDGITRLAIRDVVFTETGRNNYQVIHTIQGKKIEVRMTATELFELLSQNKYFIRCGASININLKYIRQISKDAITFDTGEHLAYPYRAYQSLKDAFLKFQMVSED